MFLSYYILTVGLIFILNLSLSAQSDLGRQDFDPVKVPETWIRMVKNFDYKSSNTAIIEGFEAISPDSLFYPQYGNQRELGGIFNPLIVNIDEDHTEEIIALIGWMMQYPQLAVFKKIEEEWFLIFAEPFHVHYSEPEVHIANVPSANKTFYIRWLNGRGSGIFLDTYYFYKIIDGKVYKCLQLINKASIFGWGLYLNQDVESSFKFNTSTSDEVWVSYEYSFFPGAVYDSDAAWTAHPEIPFISGNAGIAYVWNNNSRLYEPRFEYTELNEQKIACFGDFGNDSLFVLAFKDELQELLQYGTEEQKRLLSSYLKLVEKTASVPAPTGGIERVTKMGELTSYGPKIHNKEKSIAPDYFALNVEAVAHF